MHFHIHVLTGIVYWPQCCPNLIKSHCLHPIALKLLSVKSQANISKCFVTTWGQTKQLSTENQLLCHLGRHARATFIKIKIIIIIKTKIHFYSKTLQKNVMFLPLNTTSLKKRASPSFYNFTSNQYKTSPGWVVNVSMVILKTKHIHQQHKNRQKNQNNCW